MSPSIASSNAAGSAKKSNKATKSAYKGAAGSSKKSMKSARNVHRGALGDSKQHTKAIKRVARIIRELEKSNAELERRVIARDNMLDRIRGQRDLWRRFHKTQEQEKAELEQKIATLDAENEALFEELKPFRRGRDDIKELPEFFFICGKADGFVESPIEDTHACALARKRALQENVCHIFDREANAPVRSQSFN